MATELPPNYSTEDQRVGSSAQAPQLVIAPVSNATQFQSGNLGADGERATVEGEVQLKGFDVDDWDSVSIALRTVETAASESVELVSSEVVLYNKKDALASSATMATLPSALPFSILLTPDIPQSITTPTSSISHTLIATLHPADPSKSPFSKTVPIQIRRFSTPNAPYLTAAPRCLTLDQPTPVKIQVPRAVFRSGEMIPVYLTIPTPEQTVVRGGLQLRNIIAELVRVVKIGPVDAKAPEASTSGGEGVRVTQEARLYDEPTQNTSGYPPEKTSTMPPPPLSFPAPPKGTSSADGTIHETTVTWSGASCRFHSNRSVQLRLILHSTAQSHLDDENEALAPEVDTAAGSITQSTLLHQVSFYIRVHVNFVSPTTHSSTSVEGTIPVTMIPALAPQHDADDLESSYMKKHDKPPARTVRTTDDTAENAPPAFDETNTMATNMASASLLDPPPFSAEPSNAGGLPSFFESQAAASGSRSYAAEAATSQYPHWQDSVTSELRFPGEGELYGFKPEDQYDGLSHSLLIQRSSSPPPAMASSVNDPDVTVLAQFINPTENATAFGGERPNESGTEPAPPPPPAVDDPLDPPPSIDDRFANGPPPAMHPGEPVPPSAVGSGPPPYLGAPGAVPAAPPSYLDSR
ncbi:hypothetical protein FRB99_002623 [Tulasnella sp. 403]|nr:hypothetical protein FRB99_002623 [Tulasnella sp. 403]